MNSPVYIFSYNIHILSSHQESTEFSHFYLLGSLLKHLFQWYQERTICCLVLPLNCSCPTTASLSSPRLHLSILTSSEHSLMLKSNQSPASAKVCKNLIQTYSIKKTKCPHNLRSMRTNQCDLRLRRKGPR